MPVKTDDFTELTCWDDAIPGNFRGIPELIMGDAFYPGNRDDISIYHSGNDPATAI